MYDYDYSSSSSSEDEDAPVDIMAADVAAASAKVQQTEPSQEPKKKPAPIPKAADDDSMSDADSSDGSEMFGVVGEGEEVFYDGTLDERDEYWMHKRHVKHNHGKEKDKAKKKSQGGYATDAILSCPCCFSIVCIDCQRHAKFLGQYRAMFVQNCTIDPSQRHWPSDGGPSVRSVCCSTCSADIAVVDDDDVFHFFDVLPSTS